MARPKIGPSSTIYLEQELWDFLDKYAVYLRRSTGIRTSRPTVIRAILNKAKIELEEEIATFFLSKEQKLLNTGAEGGK